MILPASASEEHPSGRPTAQPLQRLQQRIVKLPFGLHPRQNLRIKAEVGELRAGLLKTNILTMDRSPSLLAAVSPFKETQRKASNPALPVQVPEQVDLADEFDWIGHLVDSLERLKPRPREAWIRRLELERNLFHLQQKPLEGAS